MVFSEDAVGFARVFDWDFMGCCIFCGNDDSMGLNGDVMVLIGVHWVLDSCVYARDLKIFNVNCWVA